MSTGIDYLDEVYNPITGCSGKGCKVREHCWARKRAKWLPAIHGEEVAEYNFQYAPVPSIPIPFSTVQFHPDRLDKPFHWKRPRRVGVCFMGDWMDEQVKYEWIDQILEVIAACPQHQFFSLTKQPQNLEEKIYSHCSESPAREFGGGNYLQNLWHGVSITDQEDADRMIPELLRIPGKHWVSIEPMLGPIRIFEKCSYCEIGIGRTRTILRTKMIYENVKNKINWIVLGCESGPKRRPCPQSWMIDVVRQFKAAGVKVWVKQVDINGKVSHKPEEWPAELRRREK